MGTYPDGNEITPQYVDFTGCCVEWTGSEAASASPGKGINGGTHLFGIDTATGSIVWSRATRAGAFVTAKTIFPQSGGLFAVTSDGQLIWLQRETGGILDGPVDLGARTIEIIPVQDEGIRYAIVLSDGTLVPRLRTQPSG